MIHEQIRSYSDFVETLLEAGFSMGGGNSEGIYSVINWGWNQSPSYDTPISWHTGNWDTDPWEWRIRVLEEHDDIAYAKLFFKKSGFIVREWIPLFLAVRRSGRTLEEEYMDGLISSPAKQIYELVLEHGTLPLHTIKELAGFGKEDKSTFDRALVELQMKMYLTMCGRKQKRSLKGEEYGWSSTVFCTTEHFWGTEVFDKAAEIDKDEAIEGITKQILLLNPMAESKKIMKFIKG
ncbi:AlkZ-related protein [Lacrimispora algidixylanolytica]|nr:hypothetical protein [Lacrimispora algidixylanolytica]